jgi:ribosomal protein L11 methylase PrmA
MIEALCEHDADNVQDDEHAVESAEVVDNDEVIIDSAADNAEVNDATESELIKALKLQLEIARINLQLAQTGKETAINRPDGIVNAIDLAHLKSRLPIMSPNCYILAFFCELQTRS